MEKPILVSIFLLLSVFAFAQEENPREFSYEEGDTTYTMKQYIFCIYTSGSERSQSEEEAMAIQEKHLAHLGSLEEKGLIMAGPFGDDGEKRGVLLFDLATVDEAAALVNEDPAVKANRLNFGCNPLWLAKGTRLN